MFESTIYIAYRLPHLTSSERKEILAIMGEEGDMSLADSEKVLDKMIKLALIGCEVLPDKRLKVSWHVEEPKREENDLGEIFSPELRYAFTKHYQENCDRLREKQIYQSFAEKLLSL